jgi:hypothetical protein
MPRFFFHTETESRFTDAEGTECLDHVAARHEAIRTCGEMMRDCAEGFWGSRPWSVTVTDGAGVILWEIGLDGYSSPAALRLAAANDVEACPA